MRCRRFVPFVVFDVLVTFAGFAVAQNARSGAATGVGGLLALAGDTEMPRTPWGDPDLQGVWNNSTSTPLEQLSSADIARERAAQGSFSEGKGAAWVERAGPLEQRSLIIDPPDGRLPRLRPEAVERLIDRESARAGRGAADSWLDRNSWERCITRTLPIAMIPSAYNANYQILQTPDHVVVLMEMIHEARIVPLNRNPLETGRIRQWLGHSQGRWEGDTLVVETVHFNARLDGGDYQPSHVIQTGHRGAGGTLRLVERLRLSDPNRIDYQITVEDPKVFTRPYTVAVPMTRRDTSNALNHLFEYACHEGNYGMPNLLRNGRADERQALDESAEASRRRVEAGHPGVREPAVPFVADQPSSQESSARSQ